MIFINNKYCEWYFAIINSHKHLNKKQAKIQYGYVEKHHIIPKCLGGTNEVDNIVYLSARHHFVCHKLLVKITQGQSRYKMLEAVSIFSNNKNRNLPFTSKDIELIRKSNSLAASIRNIGNDFHKYRKPHSEDRKQKSSKNASASKWINNGEVERFSRDHKILTEKHNFVYGRLERSDDKKEMYNLVAARRKGIKMNEAERQKRRKPKANKDGYQGKRYYRSLLLNKEVSSRQKPDWPDAELGRLPGKKWYHNTESMIEYLSVQIPEDPNIIPGRLPYHLRGTKTS